MQTFCAVSDSLDHSPARIWACLSLILDKILKENKDIDTVHFYSDGPSTQYKQKANFFFLSNEVESRGLKLATWNFYESGHGKKRYGDQSTSITQEKVPHARLPLV